MKILIIEDEPSLREIMSESLKREQYVVESAEDYATGLDKISVYDYDCILLDIMLPGGSGLSLLRELKKMKKDSGVVIISAKDSIDDKITGLDLGADDYLAKPFHIAELSARIKSVLRRRMRNGESSISAGNVEVTPESRRVFVAGKELTLVKKEFDILNYFISRQGHMISKETLAEDVWGDNYDLADNYDFIYAQIKNLRQKLENAGASAKIKSVYGFGYKLIVE